MQHQRRLLLNTTVRCRKEKKKKEKKLREDLLLNGVLGLCGESGEVSDYIKKWKFQGHDLNKDKLLNELGDVCWYIAVLAKALETDLETVMNLNIKKLKNRYPNGFEAERSINRED